MRAGAIVRFKETLAVAESSLEEAQAGNHPVGGGGEVATRLRRALGELRSQTSDILSTFPSDSFGNLVRSLEELEDLVKKAVSKYPSDPAGLGSDLEAIDLLWDMRVLPEMFEIPMSPKMNPGAPFIPEQIFAKCSTELQHIVHEANIDYVYACYNSCAVMIRHVVEMMIIAAYEKAGIQQNIMRNGHYMEMKDLIIAITNESTFSFSPQASKGLPKIKHYGDLGAHNRRTRVFQEDLEKYHTEIRVFLGELAAYI
jgi:hypothetical protein